MSVREEEQRKSNCSSRGLGLAAAAIGVGVGAALYYFFSKRSENPEGEGSSSDGWSCQQAQTLNDSYEESEYTTISEYTTSDTSIMDDSYENICECDSNDSVITVDDSEGTSADTSSDSVMSVSDSDDSSHETESESESETSSDSSETGYISLSARSVLQNVSRSVSSLFNDTLSSTIPSHVNVDSESDVNEWDVTNSSISVPSNHSIHTSPLRRILGQLVSYVNPPVNQNTSEATQLNVARDSKFRERSWSLEECSICFEVMLKDQELLTLPCTHNFHVACIGPWLQEQQTCPMCRKAAE